MANIDAPFGFRALTSQGDAGSTIKVGKYVIAAAEGTDLFVGDPVLITGTSILNPDDGIIYPTVARSGTSGYTTGVIVAFVPDTADSLTYKTDATTQRYVLVADDPYQLFEVQADGSMAITDVGNTADIIFTHAGSTVTGQAASELDTADIGTGTQLVIEGFTQKPNRKDLTSANPVAIVRFNLHQKRYTTGV